jgi:crystallin alpha B
LVSRWNNDLRLRDPIWRDRFSRDWEDWPLDWPRPQQLVDRFWRDTDRWWRDWPSDWPRMDTIMPRFSSHLDRFDRNWRNDPFWRDLYPRWAEPIFKEGIDVKTNIVNDRSRFAVDIDAYQFRPEELQVKTLDDTLLIEGRHEDVRDADNYTKMYFVRKYQLPADVNPQEIQSAIDSHGRLTVEARKQYAAVEGRERSIPIEGPSKRTGSRSSSYSPRERNDSGRGSQEGYHLNNYQSRPESRTTDNYLSPQTNGYRNEYSTRQADTNGVRHERHREEFREEMRRTGSAASIPIPPPPADSHFHRSESRSSRREASAYRNESRGGYRNDDFRVDTPGSVRNVETILRPAEELNGRTSRSERSVRIERKAYG